MTTTSKQPRYVQIADVLRDQIRSGELEVGEKLPSFVDMYRDYGATTATMQKVYELLEKEALIERRSRSGIYVAKTQRVRTGTLALVIPQFDYQLGPASYMGSTYAMRMLHGMHQVASSLGYQISLCDDSQMLHSGRLYDGVLFNGNIDMVDACLRLKVPTVTLIAHLPGIVCSVGVDDTQSFKQLTQHLWELGHRRIATMVGSTWATHDFINPLRMQGYREALAEVGIQAPPEWHRALARHPGKLGYMNLGYLEMCDWLREGWVGLGCTAIMAQNDAVAIGIIKALRQHGYRVPQDVSVTGYDNASDEWHFDLKLTTVDVPLDEIGRKAVTLLAAQQETPAVEPQPIYLPTQVVEGESTSKPTGENV